MLPTYLNIGEAAAWVGKEFDEPVTSDWLLQYAHEGKLPIFAFAREEVFVREQRVVYWEDAVWDERCGVVDLKKSRSYPLLQIIPEGDSESNPELECRPRPTIEQGIVVEYPGECCCRVAEYRLLEPQFAGQIRASGVVPRVADVPILPFHDQMVLVCSKGAFLPSQFRKYYPTTERAHNWQVSEDYLFFRTNDVTFLFNSFFETDKKVEAKTQVINPQPPTFPYRARQNCNPELPGLTRTEILKAPWPCKEQLDKFLRASPNWLMKARVAPGRAGIPTLWNPAEIAFSLMDEGKCRPWSDNEKKIENFLRRYFPEYINYWLDKNYRSKSQET